MRLKFHSERNEEYDVLAQGARVFGGYVVLDDEHGPPKDIAELLAECWNAVHDGNLGAIAEARAKVRAL